MQKQDYETLVWSLQNEAQDAPGMFRVKALLIGSFVHLILFALLAVLLIGVYDMLFVAKGDGIVNWIIRFLFIVWVVAATPIVLLALSFVIFPARIPQGRELTGTEAPQLFRMLAALHERLQGAPIHHVLITKEFEASIVQCARFGLLGGYRNYLVLGLPLLNALSAEELLAVVAHEYSHLSGKHNKVDRWVYRLRPTFGAWFERISARRDSNAVNRFIADQMERYAPYYNAYTQILARQHEYQADTVSRELAGAETSAAALIRMSLLANWVHGIFWPKLQAQSTQHETPPFMPYAAMRKLLMMTTDEWATKERLNAVWKAEADVYDTHPSLSERVTALGQSAAIPAMPKQCAAEALLGKIGAVLVHEFDTHWWDGEKDKWQRYFRRYTHANTRIGDLEKQPVATLNVPEAQELALLLAEFRSLAAAKPVLEDLLARAGGRHPKPVFYYGCVLLEEGNAKGLDHLEEAYRLSPSMIEDCSRTGFEWLSKKQNVEAAEGWVTRLRAIKVASAA